MKKELNKGITLIALIITIIVLLILAGITLAMVVGDNGIINKAQTAKDKTNESQQQELNELKNYEDKINNYSTGLTRNTLDYQLIWSGTASSDGDYNLNVKNESTGEKYNWSDFKFIYIIYYDSQNGTFSTAFFMSQNISENNWRLNGAAGRKIQINFGNNKFTLSYNDKQEIKAIYGIN